VSIDADSHSYKLTSSEEYELEFLQAQPGLITSLAVMNVLLYGTTLQPIGPTQLSIGSPYDVQSVRMVAMDITNGVKYTTIGLRPGERVQGPVLDIPVEIHPSGWKNAKVSIGTTVPVALIGLSAVLTDIAWPWKVLIVVVGAASAAYLSIFGGALTPREGSIRRHLWPPSRKWSEYLDEYGGRHSAPTAAYGTARPSKPTSYERSACSRCGTCSPA
jgi:hypothetical protein